MRFRIRVRVHSPELLCPCHKPGHIWCQHPLGAPRSSGGSQDTRPFPDNSRVIHPNHHIQRFWGTPEPLSCRPWGHPEPLSPAV